MKCLVKRFKCSFPLKTCPLVVEQASHYVEKVRINFDCLFKKLIRNNDVRVNMDYNVYLLATDPNNPCRDVIHSRDTSLKIRVYCLSEDQFTPDENEIQLYGYAHNKLYAFETININAEDALDVVGAIQWYADYIDYPEMEILPEDPRGGHGIAM